ncbi:MAG: T9SS type A sorting domain-containing protein [candidate division Zixibacteria bacterium]|nr:T9SS type A sorting domain-containing protein [Candidatus Tariuqbacter arcticus]
MKNLALLITAFVLLTGVSPAQISVDFLEIPADWAIESSYLAESDTLGGIPVNVGTAGGSQYWDFSQADTTTEFNQTVVSLDSTPFAEEFPNANLVMEADDLSQFGLEGPGFIYYVLNPGGLNLLGLGIEFEGTPIPVVFEEPMVWYELPMDYLDDWENGFFYQFYFDSLGMEYRLDLEGNFDAEVDAWGELAVPLGEMDALRLRNDIDIDITLYLILWGIPIEMYHDEMSFISYIWVSEDMNMTALVMSEEGETNPNFDTASAFAKLHTITSGDYTAILEPVNPPVQIPAGGGDFTYNVDLTNNMSSTGDFDGWIGVFLPSGQYIGPLINRPGLSLPAGGSLIREMEQSVPPNAPPGTYYYVLFMGESENNVAYASGGFTFEKLPGMDFADGGSDWSIWGWDGELAASTGMPGGFELCAPYPNPFNSSTAISYQLQAAGFVTLVVYDVMGREVVRLVDGYRSAGAYDVSFNGGELASGVYFAILKADGFKQARKMILVK